MSLHLVLYQPEIPQNTGTLLRLGACLGVTIHVIHPTGFVWSDRHLRRAQMDYKALCLHHSSWQDFVQAYPELRTVGLCVCAQTLYTRLSYRPGDALVLGKESQGLPADIQKSLDACVRIPQADGTRSLNVAVAGAMVVGEALRQIQ